MQRQMPPRRLRLSAARRRRAFHPPMAASFTPAAAIACRAAAATSRHAAAMRVFAAKERLFAFDAAVIDAMICRDVSCRHAFSFIMMPPTPPPPPDAAIFRRYHTADAFSIDLRRRCFAMLAFIFASAVYSSAAP